MKARAGPLRQGILELHFAAIADARRREDLFLLAGQVLPHSPWVGPRFALIPAPDLPPPSASGQVNLSIPLLRGGRGRWARFVHDRAELATLLSRRLDTGPSYPFPPPRGVQRLVDAISLRARAYLIETQVEAATLYHSSRALDLWGPLVDDFGEDLSVTDRRGRVSIRVQAKGVFGLSRGGVLDIQVRKATFRPDAFDFLVFANFDAAKAALSPWAFVVRADEFAKRALSTPGLLHFRARLDPASRGKWSPWLYRVEEIAGVFETALRAKRAWGERALLPARRGDVLKARALFHLPRGLGGGVARPRGRRRASQGRPSGASRKGPLKTP